VFDCDNIVSAGALRKAAQTMDKKERDWISPQGPRGPGGHSLKFQLVRKSPGRSVRRTAENNAAQALADPAPEA
jgi:hypothetical protein